MLIYTINNPTQKALDYVCDSQATIDAAPDFCKPTCVIGGEPEATVILNNNQQTWLVEQADLFTVNLQTNVEGGVVWSVVNLTTQPENADYLYFVLDPTNGLYTEAIGLDAAKTLLAQVQQKYLIFTNMYSFTTKTSWE